jgi:hypothetical protein
VRWKEEDRLIVVANFDPDNSFGFNIGLPAEVIHEWKLEDGQYTLEDQLTGRIVNLTVSRGKAETRIDIEALQSYILQLQSKL